MTTTPELRNVRRAAAASIGHVLEKTDQLSIANAGLRAQLDRAALLDPQEAPDLATTTAQDLLDAATAFIAVVAAQRPVETGWR